MDQHIQRLKKKSHNWNLNILKCEKFWKFSFVMNQCEREKREFLFFMNQCACKRERKNFHSSSEKYEEIVFISHESVHVWDYEEVRKRQFISNELVHVRERKGEFSFLMNECMWIWKRKFSCMNLCARKREGRDRKESF